MLIFKEVSDLVIDTTKNLKLYKKQLITGDLKDLEEKKLELLQDIVAYISSLTWLKRQDSKKKIKFFLSHKFSYEDTAREFKTSVKSIQTSVSLANKTLKSVLGDNLLTLIKKGDLDKAYIQFGTVTGKIKLSNYILEGVLARILPPNNNESIILSDCKKELEFLRMFSTINLKEELKQLDSDKLAFLLHVLQCEDNNVYADKSLILNYLSKPNSSIDDLLYDLDKINLYSNINNK